MAAMSRSWTWASLLLWAIRTLLSVVCRQPGGCLAGLRGPPARPPAGSRDGRSRARRAVEAQPQRSLVATLDAAPGRACHQRAAGPARREPGREHDERRAPTWPAGAT